MKTNEKRLLIAIIILAVIFFISRGDLKGKKEKTPPRSAKSGRSLNKVAEPLAAIKKVDVQEEIAFIKYISDFDEKDFQDVKDPFQQKATTGLSFAGLIWDDSGRPLALINSTIYGLGEKINDYTIIEITPERVVLKKGTKIINLTLNEEE